MRNVCSVHPECQFCSHLAVQNASSVAPVLIISTSRTAPTNCHRSPVLQIYAVMIKYKRYPRTVLLSRRRGLCEKAEVGDPGGPDPSSEGGRGGGGGGCNRRHRSSSSHNRFLCGSVDAAVPLSAERGHDRRRAWRCPTN